MTKGIVEVLKGILEPRIITIPGIGNIELRVEITGGMMPKIFEVVQMGTQILDKQKMKTIWNGGKFTHKISNCKGRAIVIEREIKKKGFTLQIEDTVRVVDQKTKQILYAFPPTT